MDPVRTRVCDIRKETCGQLTLNIKIILFHIARLRMGVWSQCRRTVCGDEVRDVSTSTWRRQNSTRPKGTGRTAGQRSRRTAGTEIEGAITLVESSIWRKPLI